MPRSLPVSAFVWCTVKCMLLVPGVLLCSCAVEDWKPATVQIAPAQAVAGNGFNLSVSFQQPNGSLIPVNQFLVGHERRLHLVGVGSDLDMFLHTHPEDTAPIDEGATSFVFANLSLPKAGTYTMAFDGETQEGTVANHTKLAVTGTPAMQPAASTRRNVLTMQVRALPLLRPQPPASLASVLVDSNQVADNSSIVYSITVQGPTGMQCVPGQAAYYTWRVMQASNNSPVTSLQQYLGAGMHVSVVSSDQSFVSHDHGMPGSNPNTAPPSSGDHSGHQRRLAQMMMPPMSSMPPPMPAMDGMPTTNSSFGPDVTAQLTFPVQGEYLVVGQLSTGSELLLAPIYISCEGSKTVATSHASSAQQVHTVVLLLCMLFAALLLA